MVVSVRELARSGVLRNRSGQALVEFALIAGILAFMVLGAVEFGKAWRVYEAVADATREGGRVSVLWRQGLTIDTVAAAANRILYDQGLDSAAAVKTVSPNAVPNTAQCTTFAISYPYTLGWISGMMRWTGAQSQITLKSRITFRNEYPIPAGAGAC